MCEAYRRLDLCALAARIPDFVKPLHRWLRARGHLWVSVMSIRDVWIEFVDRLSPRIRLGTVDVASRTRPPEDNSWPYVRMLNGIRHHRDSKSRQLVSACFHAKVRVVSFGCAKEDASTGWRAYCSRDLRGRFPPTIPCRARIGAGRCASRACSAKTNDPAGEQKRGSLLLDRVSVPPLRAATATAYS